MTTTLRGLAYRRIRQAAKLSRPQAAARCGLTPGTLKGIEAGLVRPTAAQHARLVALGDAATPARSQVHPEGLTAPQAAAIALTWKGFTNLQIARELGYSEQSVDNLLTDAYARLGLTGPGNKRVLAAVLVFQAAKALNAQSKGEAA
jgi:DNA-binding NarL/FixJ family response regulator